MISSDKAYDLFVKIANTSGSSKQQILKGQDVKEYLLAAYDPFTKYYVTKVSEGYGSIEFNDITWLILEQLSNHRLSGNDAQITVNSYTSGLTQKSSKLFHMILNKDLRMGMGVKTINKVFPGLIPTHDVMLAKLFEEKRVKYPCFGSPKIDGVRAKFKNGIFYSRNGHPYVGLNHLTEELRNIKVELDGELVIHGRTFQESSGLIRNDSPTPNAQFRIFEIPVSKASFVERLAMMKDIHQIGEHIFRVPHKPLYSIDEVSEYYTKCRKAGYEGTVIKPFDYEYKATRSYDWMKIKPKETLDVIVTDIYEGKGKYAGQMGGVTVDYNNGNNVGGGWSDKQREDYWRDPELILDKCIEVSFMELTDDGNFRHANFERFREDKC